MNKMKLKIIAGVLAVFLLGVCIGVLGTSIFIKRNFQQFTQAPPEDRKPFFMRHLERELDLTAEQKPKVDAIFEKTTADIRQIIQASKRETDSVMERNKALLKDVLTPDQQQKLEAMFERMQSRWKPGEHPPPPPGERRKRRKQETL